MSARLKIGNYVIDATEDAPNSQSTTPGVRLIFRDGPRTRYQVGQQDAEIPFIVEVLRDTTANLKASVNELLDRVTRLVNADLVLEYQSGQTLAEWKVSNGQYARISCAAELDQGLLAAKVLLVFTAERIAPSTGSAGDPPGLVGGIDLDTAFDSNGRGSGALSGTFQTMSHAKAWVQTIRAGTGRPDFLGSAWKFITATYGAQQQPNQPETPGEAAFTPVVATCILRALQSDLASALPAEVIDVDYDLRVLPMAPHNDEIGAPPGENVSIEGTLQLKTDEDTTFDSADTTSVAGGAVKGLVEAALAAIKTHAEARLQAEIEVLEKPVFAPSGTRGEVAFVITGRADLGSDILELIEEVDIQRSTRNVRLGGSPRTRVYPHAGGPQYRCTQTLMIRSRTLPSYRPLPFINDTDWDEDEFVPSKPVVTISSNGTREYTSRWRGAWTRVGPAPLDNSAEYASLAGVL